MESVLRDKSYLFAIRIVKLCRYLKAKHTEYILSKQVLRSGTAVGALLREAQFAESRKDFSHKLCIALKEANETEYWLELLKDSSYITSDMYKDIQPDINEIIKMLVSSINTCKGDNSTQL